MANGHHLQIFVILDGDSLGLLVLVFD